MRDEGQRDHEDPHIHVCVYRNVKKVSLFHKATTFSHLTEPREVCGSSELSDKIELTTKEKKGHDCAICVHNNIPGLL